METEHNLEKLPTHTSNDDIVSDVKIKTEDDELARQVFFFDGERAGEQNYEVLGESMPVLEENMGVLMNAEDSEPEESKMLVNLGEMRVPAVKDEIINMESHFVRYKPDGNGKTIKIWQCGICQKEFGHQYILMRHLPTHTDERKYECKQCGKAFRQMSTLSQHRAIHSKLRPYVCDVCQKTFNRVSTLISHRKTHTGMKPHRCHLCNKAFHQKGNLRNHIFTHTNERPYKCDVCQKGFNQMSNLMCHKFKAHQRVDRPKYQCPTCGKQFDRRIGLRNHEQYEHGETSAVSMMGLHGIGSSSEGSSTMISSGSTGAINGRPVATPSVKYTNGMEVPRIKTSAMKHAMDIGQVPFALLKRIEGLPVLCRVFAAGDGQMLTPATAEDIKKYCAFAAGSEVELKAPSTKVGTVRVPVVASVVQCRRNGEMHFDIRNADADLVKCSVSSDLAQEQETDTDEEELALARREREVVQTLALAEYDESIPIEHDANMYEAAASLIDLRSRPQAIEVDRSSVQMFNQDEIDIDITNSVIDLEKDHNAYGMISKKGYKHDYKRYEDEDDSDYIFEDDDDDDDDPFYEEEEKIVIATFSQDDMSDHSGDENEVLIGTISPVDSD